MQNIITLGQINDALKFTTVTAAQLAEMGFAALANKPICEALPQEEARRLRTAKLYPAESIGQIRLALAKRLAAPASCLHQIQEPSPVQADARDAALLDFIESHAEGVIRLDAVPNYLYWGKHWEHKTARAAIAAAKGE